MVNLTDIHSLTEFQRDTKEHLARIKRSGRPVVLTVNGKAAVVVQDAGAYQRMLDLLDRAEAIAGIQRGLASMKRGEGRPLNDMLEELGRKYEDTGTKNGRGEHAIRGHRSARSRGRA